MSPNRLLPPNRHRPNDRFSVAPRNSLYEKRSLGRCLSGVQAADESESPLVQLTGAWWGSVRVNSSEYGVTQIGVSVCDATVNKHGRYGSNYFAKGRGLHVQRGLAVLLTYQDDADNSPGQ